MDIIAGKKQQQVVFEVEARIDADPGVFRRASRMAAAVRIAVGDFSRISPRLGHVDFHGHLHDGGLGSPGADGILRANLQRIRAGLL